MYFTMVTGLGEIKVLCLGSVFGLRTVVLFESFSDLLRSKIYDCQYGRYHSSFERQHNSNSRYLRLV